MKFTPTKLPDEMQARIFWSQAWNLAAQMVSADRLNIVAFANTEEERQDLINEELKRYQQYFFDQLMSPYKPLLEARQEMEDLKNGKIRKKEITEEIKKGEINYEENND